MISRLVISATACLSARAATVFMAKQNPPPAEESLTHADASTDSIPSAMQPDDNVLQVNSGFENARHWNQNYGWFTRTWHVVDTVVSEPNNFLYVENIRGGSWAIEKKLQEVVGATVVSPDATPNETHSIDGSGVDGFSTNDFTGTNFTNMFKFSVVIDPVTKFEAGVRATWKKQGQDENTGMTADDMLAEQLHMCNITSTCEWMNEEMMPSSWRISSWAGGKQIFMDFIGKIENIDVDWPEIVDKIEGLSSSQKTELLNLDHPHPRGEHPHNSKLSTKGIERLCASEIYGSEWDYFQYPKPLECVAAGR